jgi:hypothetical protein
MLAVEQLWPGVLCTFHTAVSPFLPLDFRTENNARLLHADGAQHDSVHCFLRGTLRIENASIRPFHIQHTDRLRGVYSSFY